ncbi:hypothetical protein B0H16DRAFT_1456964 [Mycena metata]|uniref:Uncharacterized protein n=1 Tax=Mycena metata TaxID=1033252 RepID=A0AAD7J7T6_9AGAR|nr:hypothetical protein B0H16DRAFT_1456964 [Mycena metata]
MSADLNTIVLILEEEQQQGMNGWMKYGSRRRATARIAVWMAGPDLDRGEVGWTDRPITDLSIPPLPGPNRVPPFTLRFERSRVQIDMFFDWRKRGSFGTLKGVVGKIGSSGNVLASVSTGSGGVPTGASVLILKAVWVKAGAGLPDGSLPILASPLPPATAAKVMLVVIGLLLIAASLYYVSPTRLTRVLSDAMKKLDKVFVEVSVAGLLGLLSPEDTQTVISTYQMLRVEVGKVQAQTLHTSTSWRSGLFNFFTCSTRLFRCIKQVKGFQTHLQILQEDHRNRTNSLALSFVASV